MDISLIRKELDLIRSMLETTEKSEFPEYTAFKRCLDKFPKGCCGDTSKLVALHLKYKFGINCKYVAGKGLGDNTNASHGWLLFNDYIIDLTADQFNSGGYDLPAVFLNESSDFHSSFNEVKHSEIEINKLKSTPLEHTHWMLITKLKML